MIPPSARSFSTTNLKTLYYLIEWTNLKIDPLARGTARALSALRPFKDQLLGPFPLLTLS
jgi:hypothetical protein